MGFIIFATLHSGSGGHLRSSPSDHRFKLAIPYAIVLLALLARLLPGARTIDDSYITFRYARNLLAGDGLVYNPGERVLGTTTPLYAGLLAGLGLLAGGPEARFPEIALVLNALADAGTCLLLLYLGKRAGLPLAGASSALVWAVLPFSVTFAIGGLETSVFVLLLTGLAAAHFSGRRKLAAPLAALSLLARPDAALLVGVIGADRLISAIRRKERISCAEAASKVAAEAAAFIAPLLAWLIPAWIYYGSPVPGSITAKINAYSLPPRAAFSRLIQHYATPFMEHLTFGSAGIAIGLVLYLFLNLTGCLRIARSSPRLLAWTLFPWLWFAAYSLANPLIFRWYLTPPLPAYIFTFLAGAEFILNDLRNSRIQRAARLIARPAAAVLLAAPILLALRGWTLHPDHGPDSPAPEMAWIELELKYQEAAMFLQPLLAARTDRPVLAAGDIGALGYFTDAVILDTLGLVSPEAVPYYPTRPEYHVNAFAVSPDLIRDLQPEYIVLLEVYGREGLFKDPQFRQTYELLHVIETEIYDSKGMLIFWKP